MRNFKGVLASVVVLFVAAGAAVGSGIPTGVGGDPPTVFPGDLQGVMVGNPTDPIQIYLDPGADMWSKVFTIDITGVGISTGQVIQVWENIQLQPPPPPLPRLPLTDWHEEIHTPDWQWGFGHLDLLDIGVQVPGMVGGTANNQMWFDWGFPVFPPANISIHKELLYLGPNITPNPTGPQFITVEIWEHPTVPEPSTLVLAGLGAAALGFAALRRRRRRA